MIWQGQEEAYCYATEGDLPAIAEMLDDPEVGQWLWFTPSPPGATRDFFLPLLEGQRKELEAGRDPRTAVLVAEDSNGDFLGQGGVVEIDGSPGGFEIGYQLQRASWGRGVGMRLARFLCSYAVHVCDAFRIEASCMEGNVGSRRILERLGLSLEGTRPGYRLKEGVRHAELLFGAVAADLDSEPMPPRRDD